MYRLISPLSASSYGTNSYSYNSAYDNHQQSRFGQSNRVLQKFYQSSIQALILLLIQHQLQNILNQNNNADQQTNDQDQPAAETPYSQHCHCPCPAPTTNTPEIIAQPPPEEPAEEELENDEYALIMEHIRQLQQLMAHQNMADSLSNHGNNIARYQSDRNIIHSVQMNGGRIIETTDKFFVAEDANQSRYFIPRE